MNFDELYPGRFLKAGSLPGGMQTLTVADVQRESIEGERGTEDKVVMRFQETQLQLVLPKINAIPIKAMFGVNAKLWIGKRITFYATCHLMPFPKRPNEPCIRVYGSPDIQQSVTVEWTPPKKRKITQTLHNTELICYVFSEIYGRNAQDCAALGPWLDTMAFRPGERQYVDALIATR
jgi:hypothetical protein